VKEWLKRALRTFGQAAIGYVVAVVPTIDYQNTSVLKTTLIGLLLSSIAAGLAAVMNMDINHIK
jgi:hypothetical protein